MAGALTAAIAAAFSGGGSPPVTTDPYFEYTTLLLPGNGTNGAQNNTFLDGSTNNFTITRNGNTTQGTFSPFSQTGWGYYVPEQVSNQVNFTTSAGTDFQFAGDFTIEGWLYAANNSGDGSFYVISDNVNYLAFNISISANVFNIYLNNSTSVAITSDIPLATWTHVAMVRSGSGSGNIKLYTNGVLKGSTTNTSTLGYANPVFSRIGGGVAGIDRYYSNLRICKSAVYTGAFTPSTIPLTTTSQSATNCVLLTANSNRFLNQAVGATATITGSPRVVAFSPFNPTASWSAATYGGSGYFDGSGDYLSVPANSAWNLGSGSFCIECWSYPTATQSDRHLFSLNSSGGTGYWILRYNTGTIPQFIYNNYTVSITSSTAAVINAWNHIAMVSNGTTMSLYLNGARVATGSATSINDGSANPLLIGSQLNVSSREISGYFTDGRVVKGSSVYDPTQTTLTVPTAPLTAITNTSLLLNFTNAGIYDATSKNDLETVGDARINTAIPAKWGTGSILLEGTSDRLFNGTSSPLLNLSSGDWTVECWVYFNAVAAYAYVLNIAAAPSNNSGVVLGISNTSKIYIGNGVALGTAGNTTLSTGQWYYLAWVKSGANVTMYVNGSSDVTPFAFTPNSGTYAYIGSDASAGNQLNAYIQDLRVTRGVARVITASPTAAFPTL